MVEITPFAGLDALEPGETPSSDGYKFQLLDRFIIDRILRIGAVTHKHDAHGAMPNPTDPPVVSTANAGGVIPAGVSLSVTYTWVDAQNGETLPVSAVVVSTSPGYLDPFDELGAVVDYTAGTLLSDNYSYAATVADGRGGETAIGPAALVSVDPGNANAEVTISGLAATLADSSGGDPAASWRLWRSNGDGPWYLLGTGTGDTFLDNGVAGDCTVAPPNTGSTAGSNTLTVTVPGATAPGGLASFNVYVSLDGSFTTPALLGIYPLSQFDTAITYTDLTVSEGAPPTVSTSLPGANQINPDTDIVNWYWKSPVDTATDLPLSGNNDGDARITRDTDMIWVWDNAALVWRQWNPAGATLVSSQQAASYTLAVSDAGTVVEFTVATAVTLTIPANVLVGFPVGTIIEVFQYGAGQVTVTAGAGVTLRTFSGVHTAGQYATISLRQRDVDEWVLSGALA
jgi:hypothetical protein